MRHLLPRRPLSRREALCRMGSGFGMLSFASMVGKSITRAATLQDTNGVPGAIIVTKFVLASHGRSIFTVVTSLTPPPQPGKPAAALPPGAVFISSEGHKLGRFGED